MGYAVLHIDKARGNDSAMTAHIERTFVPSNVDATRTHLNRELLQFPVNVTNRTQAIEHRIATAGIYRKVADNQVKALRFLLSGSHEDLINLEKQGRLDEWAEETMLWLRKTFGEENVVAATLHVDEETPHIHATVVPIVCGERRKAKAEAENGKRKYKTKKDKVRLSADDVLTPKKLEEYQTSYAKAMARFGLERGVHGSTAKHRSNMEYYKELLKANDEKRLEQAKLERKIQELEKLAGKLRIKGTLYSLFGNSELDKAEARISELERQANEQRRLSEREKAEIRKEVILLEDTIKQRNKSISAQECIIKAYEEERSWVQRYLGSVFALLNIRRQLRFMGFTDEKIAEMYRTEKPERGTARTYSILHKRVFTEEDCDIRITRDAKHRPFLCINGLSIIDWCEHKWQQLTRRNRAKKL